MSRTELQNPQVRPADGRDRRVAVDLGAGVVLIAVAALFLANSGEDRLDWLFPVGLAWGIVAIGVFLIVRGLLGYGDRMSLVPPVIRGQGIDVAVFVVFAVLYVVLSPIVGFWVMSMAFIAASSIYLDNERSARHALSGVVVAVSIAIVAYLFLLRVFYVPLPESRWLPF